MRANSGVCSRSGLMSRDLPVEAWFARGLTIVTPMTIAVMPQRSKSIARGRSSYWSSTAMPPTLMPRPNMQSTTPVTITAGIVASAAVLEERVMAAVKVSW